MTVLLLTAAALLSAQAAPASALAAPDPAAQSDADVVVLGRRLKRMRLAVRFDRQGRVTCRVRRSSGNAATDVLACQATLECAASSAPGKEQARSCVRDRLVERLGIPADRIHY